MSSNKSKKHSNKPAKDISKKSERMKHIDDEDKELDELEKIISNSKDKDKDKVVKEQADEDLKDENDDFFASLDKNEQDIKPFYERQKKKNNSKSEIAKIIELLKQNTKYAIWGSIISVLFIALIIALAVDAGNKNSGSVKNSNKIVDNKLIKNSNKEIEELVKTYFTSLVTCDVDKLSQIMDSVENISVESLKKESEYIEEYKNIECFTKKGIADNDYVVYVYYENKILNIDTLAPGAIILYVKKDEEKGSYRIHNGINDAEISKYISKLTEDKDVKKFNKDVDDKFKKACENDADLKAFYDALISASQPANDNTVSAENENNLSETQSQQETQPEQQPQDQPQQNPAE